MSAVIRNISEHIYNVCAKNGKDVSEGYVRNKLENMIHTESLSKKFEDKLNKLFYNTMSEAEVLDFVDNALLSNLNEGFYNPFDTDEDGIEGVSILADPRKEIKDSDNCPIRKVTLWNNNVNGKISCEKGKMYSNRFYFKGDILEECPVKLINVNSLNDRVIREIAFELEVDENGNGVWGIPMGYANCYTLSTDTKELPNVDYEYDPEEGIIRFYAISTIKPHKLLVLRVEDEFIK